MIWLGVDGGGTKTAGALVDDTGRVLAETVAPSSYYLHDGLDGVRAVLRVVIGALCNEAGTAASAIDHGFFGLPAYGEVSADVPVLDTLPADVLGHARYTCGNDMVCAWAGSLGGGDGVNVIGGTGSMTYGERAGVGARVGGWGEVFGDEGSAYWIGVEGLRAASRMSDGRRARGPLLDVLVEHLGLEAELDLVDVVLNRWHGDRGRIAGLARQVTAAAAIGDETAAAVLAAAGRELALLVTATADRLAWPAHEPLPVSWSGGVFGSAPVRAAFRSALADAAGEYDLRAPLLSPVLGAALHAARLAGHPLSERTVATLQGAGPVDAADPVGTGG